MPEYDFKCQLCQKDFSVSYKSFSAYARATNHACPKCDSLETKRAIGRVAITQSQSTRLDRLADPTLLNNIDENDPQAVTGFMQKLGKELDSNVENDSLTADQESAKKST